MEVRQQCRSPAKSAGSVAWRTANLDECVQEGAPICYGILMPGSHCTDGVPVIKVRDIFAGRIDESDLLLTHPSIDHAYRRSRLAAGDVLVTIRGSTGRVAIVSSRLNGANITQDTARVRVKPDINARYVYFALQSEPVQKQIALHTIGLAVKGINIRDVRCLEILLPREPAEQRAIATALSDVDALLSGLDRLIAKKRDLKQAAMQQLLTGVTRLPGFDGEWANTTLGEIGECVIGLTYKPENVVDHGLLVLRSSNVQEGRLAFVDNVFVNVDVPEHLYTRTGDILVCVRNGSRALIGKSAVINAASERSTFGAFMSVFRTKAWRFVAHAFKGDEIQRQIRDNIGATINQITNKDMKAFRIKLPAAAEQSAIADVLSDMDAELSALVAQRDKTRALKLGMMQELLTGRTHLI